MASLSDFLQSKALRKSPFEGFQQRGRSTPWVARDLYFQNSSSCSEKDAYTSKVTWNFEQKVRCRSLQNSKGIVNYSKSNKEESKQNKYPDWTSSHCLFSETPMADMDSKMLQDIENALEIAKINLEELRTMEEMLQQLVTEAKLEEGRIAGVINAKFAELVTSLNSRKRKLETELVTNSSYYVTAVHGVQVSVTQKRSILDGAIKVVKQMKASHSLKPSHNLNQIFRELQMTIEEEVLKLDNLKKRTLPCFEMDCDEITSFFENMGKFCFDISNMHNFGGSSLKLSITEAEFKNNASTEIKVALQPVAEEIPVVAYRQKSNPCFEGSYTQFQEIAPAATHKWIVNSSPTTSDPDVIVEEIFEDDQEKPPELVFVSCVVNPCHFYVRKVSQKKTEVHLERILRKFCNKKSSSPNDILELGTRIFVRSKEHGMWCRAEIIQLVPVQNTNEGKPCGPTKYKICDIAMLKVFLIDYGHPEALIVSGVPSEIIVNPEHVTLEYIVTEDLCMVIRKPDMLIEAQLRGISKLALHCSLKDIVPKNAIEGWKREARTTFLRMINNKAVLMKVFREENGVLIVDLMKPATNKISSDMPVSLRNALVFLDLARFRIELSEQSERNVPLQYFPPMIPQKNAEVAAVVSYINSPDDFYIQLLEDGPEFAVFLNKVEEVYKNERGANLDIFCPIQGQPCVAKFDDDGIWYRAQVIELLDDQEVEVKYVDFGNVAKINVKGLRKIKDEFLALPAKAIRCKLAHIAPYEGTNEWSSKSKIRFEELIQDKCMLCIVEEKSQNGTLSVELYDATDKTKLSCSVNSILVKEDLASYLTSNTKTTTRSHNEVWDPALEEIVEKGRDSLQSDNKILSEFEDLALDCNKELQVQIKCVVSPSKIFVHFMSSEQTLKSLQERMTATYVGTESETVQWTVDMKCAAYERDLNQWQRGQVCRIVSEKAVEVFLFDLGVARTLDTACLRELKEDLKTIRPLAVECFLKDIRPAGGTAQWTATACDTLAGYLTGALVTLIIQENNSSPLPVKILSKDGGLCTDISEYMVKKGLALRKGRPAESNSVTTSSSKLPETPSQQKDADMNNLLTKTECTPGLSVSEKETDSSVTDSKEEELEAPVSQPVMSEAYKPPVLPSSDIFTAIVSYVSDKGTIYVIPKSQEQQRKKLMSDIQNNFKCLGLLEPYSWKTGEACVVRAADTMWCRGEVREVGIGIIKVQYLDYGYIEKIPQCHLYPTLLYADIPPFSIPCELSKVVPVGNVWQQDAVELLQELLTERLVEIHIMEKPDNPWGNVSIKLFFAGMPLSSFMAYHKHCVSEDDDDSILKLGVADCSEYPLEENCEISHEELLLAEVETPLLPPYSSPSLPAVGHLFPVQITHIVSPNEVYIAIAQSDDANQHDDREDRGTECNYEMLNEILKYYNENTDSLSFLTDFRTGMPCLARYKTEALWYRAKVLSIQEFHPVSILVKYVDYGSTDVLPTSRLRQIPSLLMQYPARAFKVLLAGFKPALYDPTSERIPYCPEWTMEALWGFIDYIEGKTLYASTVTYSPEHTVFLYEDGNLFHIKLVEAGLAEFS